MAHIRADEISRILSSEIQNFDAVANVSETGSVISVGDGIARVFGLENVMAGELVEFGPETVGIALNLEEDQVGTVLLGDYSKHQGGRPGTPHGPDHVGSGGRCSGRARGECAGRADRWQRGN